jgi:hypothetical protein
MTFSTFGAAGSVLDGDLLLNSDQMMINVTTTLPANTTLRAGADFPPVVKVTKFTENSANDFHYSGKTVALTTGNTYEFQCYVKSSNRHLWLQISSGSDSADCVTNLSDGTFIQQSNNGVFSSPWTGSAVAVGNGFFFVRAQITPVPTDAGAFILVGLADSTVAAAYQGDGSSFIELFAPEFKIVGTSATLIPGDPKAGGWGQTQLAISYSTTVAPPYFNASGAGSLFADATVSRGALDGQATFTGAGGLETATPGGVDQVHRSSSTLPGVGNFLASDGGIQFRSVSVVKYGTRVDTTVTKPSGTVDGDLLVAFVSQGNNTPVTINTPSGWTLEKTFPDLTDGLGFDVRNYIYTKVASSEPADWTWTHASTNVEISILAIVGANTSAPISPALPAALNTTGAGVNQIATATGITTTVDHSLVIFYTQDWADTANSLAPPTGTTPSFTERVDPTTTTLQYLATGRKRVAGATGNYSHTINSTTANPRGGLLVGIVPFTGFTAWDGTALFNGASSFAAYAVEVNLGSATFNGIGTFTEYAAQVHRSAATLPGSSTLKAGLTEVLWAKFIGASTLPAFLTQVHRSTATLNGASTLFADGTIVSQGGQVHDGVAIFNGAGNLSAYLTQVERAAATFQGASTALPYLNQVERANATLPGSSTLKAGLTEVPFAIFNGAGGLAATPRQVHAANALLSGAGLTSAFLTQVHRSTALLAGTSDFFAMYQTGAATGTATLPGAGGLIANSIQVHAANARLPGTSSLTAAGAKPPVEARLPGSSSLAATLTQRHSTAALLAGASDLVGSAIERYRATAVLAGAGDLKATTTIVSVTPRAEAWLPGMGGMVAAPVWRYATAASLSGAGLLKTETWRQEAILTRYTWQVVVTAATFAGTSSLAADATKITRTLEARWAGDGALAGYAAAAASVTARFDEVGSVFSAVRLQARASTALAGDGRLSAAFTLFFTSARIAGTSSLAASMGLNGAGSALFAGATTLTTDGQKLFPLPVARLAGATTLTTQTRQTLAGSSIYQGASALAAATRAIFSSSARLTGQTTLRVSHVGWTLAQTRLPGTSKLRTVVTAQLRGAAAEAGSSTFRARLLYLSEAEAAHDFMDVTGRRVLAHMDGYRKLVGMAGYRRKPTEFRGRRRG